VMRWISGRRACAAASTRSRADRALVRDVN
jgi:hypothetical protein